MLLQGLWGVGGSTPNSERNLQDPRVFEEEPFILQQRKVAACRVGIFTPTWSQDPVMKGNEQQIPLPWRWYRFTQGAGGAAHTLREDPRLKRRERVCWTGVEWSKGKRSAGEAYFLREWRGDLCFVYRGVEWPQAGRSMSGMGEGSSTRYYVFKSGPCSFKERSCRSISSRRPYRQSKKWNRKYPTCRKLEGFQLFKYHNVQMLWCLRTCCIVKPPMWEGPALRGQCGLTACLLRDRDANFSVARSYD